MPVAAEDAQAELISIARIARPQGRHGEVIADLLTDFPDRFAKLPAAHVKRANGEVSLLTLERSRLHKGRVVLKFAGYDSINQAEELRNAQVLVTRTELVRLPADTYYDFDLLDCEVVTTDGRRIGQVKNVQRYGAAPLLGVHDGEREHLIPLATSICLDVDIAQKRIIVALPDGLLDL